jgi:hypothetical protein
MASIKAQSNEQGCGKLRIDISQYENRLDVMRDWQRQHKELSAKSQRVALQESSAREILLAPDTLPFEKRQAKLVLADCENKQDKISAALERCDLAITNLKRELAKMQPEYNRQKHLTQVAALTREGSRVVIDERGKTSLIGHGFRP